MYVSSLGLIGSILFRLGVIWKIELLLALPPLHSLLLLQYQRRRARKKGMSVAMEDICGYKVGAGPISLWGKGKVKELNKSVDLSVIFFQELESRNGAEKVLWGPSRPWRSKVRPRFPSMNDVCAWVLGNLVSYLAPWKKLKQDCRSAVEKPPASGACKGGGLGL